MLTSIPHEVKIDLAASTSLAAIFRPVAAIPMVSPALSSGGFIMHQSKQNIGSQKKGLMEFPEAYHSIFKLFISVQVPAQLV